MKNRYSVSEGMSVIPDIILQSKIITKKDKKVSDIIISFDIETTRIDIPEENRINHQSIMYLWQLGVLYKGNTYTMYGRTWKSFFYFYEKIQEFGVPLIIWVHNLSHEFQFLSGFINFSKEDVFCLKSRKILKATDRNITFRCSYLHCNMSLDKYAKTWKVTLKSKMDYEVERYPWTPLDNEVIDYSCRDVEALCESLSAEMSFDNDTLLTVPYTSTSYVRRDLKRLLYANPWTLKKVKECYPDARLYKKLRDAFRGGDTHANRHYSGKIINTEVHSYDEVSAYIYSIVCQKYPVTPFKPCQKTPDISFIIKHKYAYLFYAEFENIRLKSFFDSIPYISESKNLLSYSEIGDMNLDNGRILSAERIKLCLTDYDIEIISNEYEWSKIIITDIEYSEYGYLPKPYRESAMDYFVKKTQNDKGTYIYSKSKNKLNSLYGMHAENPVHENTQYINGEYKKHGITSEYIESELKKGKEHAFTCYTWGCWTTAHARYNLWELQNIVRSDLIYGDTDSSKFCGDYSSDIDTINNRRIEIDKKMGGYAYDKKGNIHYLGIFEKEPDMSEFITLGAKKYAYRDNESGKLHITVSGVSSKKDTDGIPLAVKELEEAGGLSAFDKMVFKAGKLGSQWNDTDYGFYNIDGHRIYIHKNVALFPSEYTMKITPDYKDTVKLYNILYEMGDIWNET